MWCAVKTKARSSGPNATSLPRTSGPRARSNAVRASSSRRRAEGRVAFRFGPGREVVPLVSERRRRLDGHLFAGGSERSAQGFVARENAIPSGAEGALVERTAQMQRDRLVERARGFIAHLSGQPNFALFLGQRAARRTRMRHREELAGRGYPTDCNSSRLSRTAATICATSASLCSVVRKHGKPSCT